MRSILRILFALGTAIGIVVIMAASREAFGAAPQNNGALLPNVPLQFFNSSGVAVASGRLCSLAAGTTTSWQATYQDAALATPNVNPQVLSTTGHAATPIYLASLNYKFILYLPYAGVGSNTCNGTQVGSVVWTLDNVYDFAQLGIFTSVNNRQFCVTGANFGVKYTAAVALLPSTGGIVDCSNLQGAQTIASDVFTGVTKPITLIWPTGTASSAASLAIPSTTSIDFPAGGILSMASATTATISGGVTGTLSQHFAGSGSVVTTSARVTEVYPQWWGALGDGTTDDSSAFQSALNSHGQVNVIYTSGGYKITTPLVAVTGMSLIGKGAARPTLSASVNGKHIIGASSVTNIVINGIAFNGTGSATVPTDSVGGAAAANTGLVTLDNATEVSITNSEFGNFYNGFTSEGTTRLWFKNNYVHNFKLHGVLVSKSNRIEIDDNRIIDCDQTGAVGAYGVQATGDQAGGTTAYANSISRNVIANIPSWDGIMTHDIDGLSIIGNDIRNVRQGIDVGHLGATNVVKNVRIIGNYVKSTTTDTWGGVAASIGGILVAGFSNSVTVANATIANNVIDGFFATAGMVAAGNSSNIVVVHTTNTTVSGNVVTGAGANVSNAGVFVVGEADGLAITGNSLQGTMAGGAVRLASVTAGTVAVVGNNFTQSTVTDPGILLSGTTNVTAGFSYDGNATNSSAGNELSFGSTKFVQAGSFRQGSSTYDPPNLNTLIHDSTNVTVTGAQLGDLVLATSFSLDSQNVLFSGAVTAPNVVTVTLFNTNAGAVDLASGTIRVQVRPRNQ